MKNKAPRKIQIIFLLLFLKALIIILLLFSGNIYAQNTNLLSLSKNSKITTYAEGNKLMITETPQTGRQYLHIQYKPGLHRQYENKGINRLAILHLKHNLEIHINDSTVAAMQIDAGKSSITILFDSLLYKERFFYVTDSVLRNGSFSEPVHDGFVQEVLESNFPPQLPPYEVLKRKNAEQFYGTDHPRGEVFHPQGIAQISPKQTKNYYNSYLLPAPKYIQLFVHEADSVSEKLTEKYFFLELPPAAVKEKIPSGKLPKTTQVFFYESPEELVSNDTYLNLMYQTSPFDLNPKNYAILHLTHHIIAAHKIGLLHQLMVDSTNTASYVFSEIRLFDKSFEHNMGLIMPPENLQNALALFSDLMYRLQNENISLKELSEYKESYLQRFESNLRSSLSLIALHNDILRYDLPADYFHSYNRLTETISARDIQRFANNFLKSQQFTISVFGKEQELKDQLLFSASHAQINSYSPETNSYRVIPYGFSANDVIRQFLIKTGADMPVEDHFLSVSTHYDFNEIEVNTTTEILRKGNRFLQKKYNITDSLQKEPYDIKLFDGKKPYRFQNGSFQPLSGIDSARLEELSPVFPELRYISQNYEISLLGIDTINLQECYQIEIALPYGYRRVSSYSIQDSLKLKTETYNDTLLLSTLFLEGYTKCGKKHQRLIPSKQILEKEHYKASSILDSVNFDIKIRRTVFKPF